MNKTKSSWVRRTQIKTSETIEKIVSIVKQCYTKLPKLSKKKALASSLLFLQGVSATNFQETTLNSQTNLIAAPISQENSSFSLSDNSWIISLPNGKLETSATSSAITEFINDNYKALDLEIDASEEEVKKSYKKLSLQWHPDKNLHNNTTAKFQTIQNAYQIIQEIFRIENSLKSENIEEIIIDWQIRPIDYPEKPSDNKLNSPSTPKPIPMPLPRTAQPNSPSSNSLFPNIFAEAATVKTPQAHSAGSHMIGTLKAFSNVASTTYNLGSVLGSISGVGYLIHGILEEKTELDEKQETEQKVIEREEKEIVEENKTPNEIPKEDQQKKIDVELQIKAIATVNKHWEENATNNKIDNKSKEQILNHGLTLPIDTWEKDIQAQTGKENIEAKRDTYLQKINLAKKEEIRKKKVIIEDDEEEEKKKESKSKPKITEGQPTESGENDGNSQKNGKSDQANSDSLVRTESKKSFLENNAGLLVITGTGLIGTVAVVVFLVTKKKTKY